MKFLASTAAFGLALALATPGFATSDKASSADTDAKSMQQEGPVSDIPRNQPGCEEAGGSWDDAANVCKDAKM